MREGVGETVGNGVKDGEGAHVDVGVVGGVGVTVGVGEGVHVMVGTGEGKCVGVMMGETTGLISRRSVGSGGAMGMGDCESEGVIESLSTSGENVIFSSFASETKIVVGTGEAVGTNATATFSSGIGVPKYVDLISFTSEHAVKGNKLNIPAIKKILILINILLRHV